MNRPIARKDPGSGWLVLSGAVPTLGGAFPMLADQLLMYTDLALPVLGIVPDPLSIALVRDFMEELEILIQVDVGIQVFDRELDEGTQIAGLYLLAGGTSEGWHAALDDTALEGLLLQRLRDGAVLIAAGAPAACFGSWILSEQQNGLAPGCGWLPNGFILPAQKEPLTDDRVRQTLIENDHSYALGIPEEAAIALGPQGELEVQRDMR